MKLLPHYFLFFWKSRWVDKSKMDQPHLPFLRSNYTPPATSPSNTQQYSEAGLSQCFKQDCVFQIPIVWVGTELRPPPRQRCKVKSVLSKSEDHSQRMAAVLRPTVCQKSAPFSKRLDRCLDKNPVDSFSFTMLSTLCICLVRWY